MKREVLDANLLLKEWGLVIFTWGNVSAIDRQSGQVVIKPSSDLATHLELYRQFAQCGAVAHTHSRMATAWAQAGMDLPAYGTTHADYFYGSVPCTRRLTTEEINGAYEYETGKVIAETFAERNIKPMDVPGVLVCSHGPFTWGATPTDAVHNTMVLEEVAAMACHSRSINPQITAMPSELLDRHYLRKHGADAYYGQS